MMKIQRKKGRDICLSLNITCWLWIVFLLLEMTAGILPTKANADYTEGYLEYVLTDNRVEITGYFGEEEETVVPAQIAGYPVSVVRTGAFSSAETLTKVTLPDTVTEIQEGAFTEGQTVVYTTQDVLQTISFPVTYENSNAAADETASIAAAAENSAVLDDSLGMTGSGVTQVEELDPYSEEIEFDEDQGSLNDGEVQKPLNTPPEEEKKIQKDSTEGEQNVAYEEAQINTTETGTDNQPGTGRMLLIGMTTLVLLTLIGLVLAARRRRVHGRHEKA